MLNSQTIQHELILINSGSDDESAKLLSRSGANVIGIDQSSFNHGGTRNLGVKLAKSEVVVFLTQDALPVTRDALERLVQPLMSDSNVAMAYGRQLPNKGAGLFGRLARHINYPSHSLFKDISLIPKLGIRTCSCSNSFAAYRKSTLLSVGGFPETTILGEDVSVAARFILGNMIVAYVADAEVYHSHDYTMKEEFKRYFDIGIFHSDQKDVLSRFQRAESEGIKFVKDEISYMKEQHELVRLPELLARTIAKYVGYSLGVNQKYIPVWMKRQISMHPHHWPKVC
jgi:rhamnosyltransferase